MPDPRQVFVAVIGVGGVGKCFLSQLQNLSARLSRNTSAPVNISVVLISRSSKSIRDPTYRPLDLRTWESDLQSSTSPAPKPAELASYLAAAPENVVLVDNTSDQTLAAAYPLFLNQNISIITPNKKAFSSSYTLWQEIFSAAANGTGSGGFIFHESTVGACLPVISALKEMVETGDRVKRIEGVFSGTMSFLFNSFMPLGGGGGSFSTEVAKAKELGFTEPDPRDDLNGLDVARKLTILARIAGLEVSSPTSFPVQSLIPPELDGNISAEEFMKRLPQFDDRMEVLKKEAAAEGKVVRYVGSVDVEKNKLTVGLEKFEHTHPIAMLKGSANIISFHSDRYSENPLIIQGPGAGGEQTAMGVSGDLIKALRALPSKS